VTTLQDLYVGNKTGTSGEAGTGMSL
jgi:hypothetical protein